MWIAVDKETKDYLESFDPPEPEIVSGNFSGYSTKIFMSLQQMELVFGNIPEGSFCVRPKNGNT
jgi:hypothetical protein